MTTPAANFAGSVPRAGKLRIGVGEAPLSFRVAPSSDHDLTAFEESSGVLLPPSYRRFLTNVGAGSFYVNEFGAGVEVLAPENVAGFSAEVFDNFGDDLFPRLLLSGSLPGLGDVGGFAVAPALGEENFSAFSHEEDPATWIKDGTDVSFEWWGGASGRQRA